MSSHFCPRCGARTDHDGECERDHTPLVAITASSLLGTEVGNYVLVQALGEGGMGAVYRAVHPAIGSEVAIKVLNATSDAASYLREAQAVNRVRHPGLIRILDSGYLGDRRPYLVMELLDGSSLADLVGKLSPELSGYVAAEALEALHAVHEQAVVHRDLKPANVFVTREGRVVVLDFGIAKLTDRSGAAPTHSSALIGTPEYMAPEQIRALAVDGRTDVYAIGVLLYETITARRPFAAAATFEMLMQHVERPPTSPRDYVPALSPALADIILKALEKDPARRFPTAGAMAAELRDVCGDDRRDELVAIIEQVAGAERPVPLETPRPGMAAPATTPMRGKTPPERASGNSAATLADRPSDRALDREPGREPVQMPGETQAPRRRPAPVDAPTSGAAPAPAPAPLPAPAAMRRSRAPLAIAAVLVAGAGAAGLYLAVRHEPRVAQAPADAAVPASQRATLEIQSQPDGASISIDSIARGPAPLTLALPAGPHHIRAELAGHVSAEQEVTLVIGERVAAVLSLPALPVADVDVGGADPDAGAGSGSATRIRSSTVRTTPPSGHTSEPAGPATPVDASVAQPHPDAAVTLPGGSHRKQNPYPDD